MDIDFGAVKDQLWAKENNDLSQMLLSCPNRGEQPIDNFNVKALFQSA